MMSKDKRVEVHVDPALYLALEKLARRENRTLESLVDEAVDMGIKKWGKI